MNTREVAVTAIFVATAVAGRIALAFIPNVSLAFPVIFLSAILFGYKIGGVVGFLTYIISDLYLGPGPWTIINASLAALVGMLTGLLRFKIVSDKFILFTSVVLLTLFFDISSSVLSMSLFGVSPIIAIIGLFMPIFIGFIPYPMGPVHEITNGILTILLTHNLQKNHLILRYLGVSCYGDE